MPLKSHMTQAPNDDADSIAILKADLRRAEMFRSLSMEIAFCSVTHSHASQKLASLLYEYFDLIACVVIVFDPAEKFFVAGDSDDTDLLEHAPKVASRFYKLVEESLLQNNHVHVMPEDAHRSINENLVFGKMKRVQLTPIVAGRAYFGAVCMMQKDNRDLLSIPSDRSLIDDLVFMLAGTLEKLAESIRLKETFFDSWTGLPNKILTYAKLITECSSATTVACLYIDIDNYAKIVEKHGDACGSQATLLTAGIIDSFLNIPGVSGVSAGRYGTDEFVLLLSGHDTANATLFAARMCAIARNKTLHGSDIPLTLSIGICSYPADVSNLHELIDLAQHAMRYAKHIGKDRFCSISDHVRVNPNQSDFSPSDQYFYVPFSRRYVVKNGAFGIIGSIMKEGDRFDGYNSDRALRISDYCGRMSMALRLSQAHMDIISLTGILHDLGKLAVDRSILQKPASLTPEEWSELKLVPQTSEQILSRTALLARVGKLAAEVHENWDGSGYPAGLNGEGISLEARIVGLVNAYVAMSSDRPYRRAMSPAEAMAELKKEAGIKWDARLLKLFAALLVRMGELESKPAD